jgi:outer membrane lipoprotein-sorting protein
MRRSGIATLVLVALGFAGSIEAQQPGNSRKAKQTHDQGIDDAPAQQTQAGKESGERAVSTVAVDLQPGGLAVAELDESFDEVLVLRLETDGTRTYIEVQGTDAATQVIAAPVAPAAPPLEEK